MAVVSSELASIDSVGISIAGLFVLNDRWVDAATLLFAICAAVIAIVVTLVRKTGTPITAATIGTDIFRGASAFPLALFTLAPLFPKLGEAAASGNSLLLSFAAANGLVTVVGDWWRNT